MARLIWQSLGLLGNWSGFLWITVASMSAPLLIRRPLRKVGADRRSGVSISPWYTRTPLKRLPLEVQPPISASLLAGSSLY